MTDSAGTSRTSPDAGQVDRLLRRLAGGGAWSLLLHTAGAGLLLASELVLARLLGAEEFGGYAWAVTLLTVLGSVSLFGLNQLLLRWLPACLVQGSEGRLLALIRYAFGRGIAFSLLILLAGFALLRLLPGIPHRDLAHLALLGVPFVALLYLLQAVLRAQHRIREALAPDLLFRPLWLLLGAGVVWWSAPRLLGAVTAMWIHLAGLILAVLLTFLLARPRIPVRLAGTGPAPEKAPWSHTTRPLAGLSLLILLQSRMDLLITGLLVDPQTTGHYAAALRIAGLLVFPLMCLNVVAASLLSSAHATGGARAVQRVVDRINFAMLITTVPLLLFLIVGGSWMLSLFGEGFDTAYPVLLILVLGQGVNAMSGPVGLVMMMTGQESAAMRILGATSLISLVLYLLLIPSLGILGAALTSATTTLLWNFAMLLYLHHRLGLRWNPLALLATGGT